MTDDDICIYDMTQLPAMLGYIRRRLRLGNEPIFRLVNRMVNAYRWELPSDADSEMVKHDDGALVVEDVDDDRLLYYIIDHCKFQRYDGRKKAYVDYAPPASLARYFLASKDHWRLRPLSGVIQSPTLRADGSLLIEEGYDAKSGLFLDLGGVEYPAIPDKPTKADALAALELLKTPFEEFPFAITDFECPSLSVALSAVLTGLIRRTLRTAPLHGFDAPEAGSGKGLACNVVSLIVTGKKASAINFGQSDTEFRKLLFAALLANTQVVRLDNLTRPLEGESLCSALTEETLGDRILGVSKNADVPTNALFLANGNNLGVKGDMHRRIIAARIDPGERPDRRTFERPDLLGYVMENRPALVAAGLTILRAYEVAGRPIDEDVPAYGSFEDWSARVRHALLWLGEVDPCITRDEFQAHEPERERLGALLGAIHQQFPGWFTAAKVATKAQDDPELRDTIAATDAPNSSARAIGEYLVAQKDRVVDGLRLSVSYDSHAKVRKYRIEQA